MNKTDQLIEQFRDALARALGREMALQKENQRLHAEIEELKTALAERLNRVI